MGNCLVTKLKSVVNNDELDIFNEFEITIPYVENPTGDYAQIRLQKKDNYDSFTMTFNGEIYDGDYRLNTSPVNVNIAGYLNTFFRGINGNDCIVKVKSVYALKKVAVNTNSYVSRGLKSLLSSVNCFAFNNRLIDLTGLEKNPCIVFISSILNKFDDINAHISDKTHLKYLANSVDDMFGSYISEYSRIQFVGRSGNVEYLPASVRYVWGEKCTGSLNNFVQNMVTAGRTNGSVKFPYMGGCETLMLNGESTAKYFTDHNLTSSPENYIVWNSTNDIQLTDSVPSGYVEAEDIDNIVIE